MSNYVKSTDFAAKDALVSGNPAKLIKGTEINDEFNNIQTSIATKADLASPAFSGNPTCATQAIGNNSTRVANTAFVQQEIADAESAINITGGTIDSVAITGGTISGLTSPLDVADGGTGKTSLALNNVLLGNNVTALQEVAPSTAGNVLTSDGTTWSSAGKITYKTVTSASGSAVEFLSIPSWVKRISIIYNGLSLSGSDLIQVQLGAGTYVTSGYTGSAGHINNANITGVTNFTAGFGLTAIGTNASIVHGIMTIVNQSGTTWVASFSGGRSDTTVANFGGGAVTLGATLDRLKIMPNGLNTFDAGSINISFE